MPDTTPEATGTSSTTATAGTQGGLTEASLNAAIDAAMGEVAAETAAAPETPAAAPAPAQAAPEQEPDAAFKPDDLRALARAQARLSRERQQMKEQGAQAKEEAKRSILKAIESDDPNHALAELGLSAEQRRIITQRLVIGQVPADQAPESLKHQVELAALQSRYDRRIEALEKRYEADNQARTAAEDAKAQKAAEDAALSAMDEAFKASDGPLGKRYQHARQREMVKRDAFDVGREMLQSGEITTRMNDREIATKIAARLNRDYAEAFGAAAAPAATATPAPGARQVQVTRPGEVTPGRTLGRGASAPLRAPSSSPMSERDVLDALADEFRASRRAGDLG